MPASVTITAKTGPNIQNTALAIPNVLNVNFDFATMRISITTANQAGNQMKEYELTTATTIAVVNTAGSFAITIA